MNDSERGGAAIIGPPSDKLPEMLRELAALRSRCSRYEEALRALEWSATREGAPYGPMHNPGRGPLHAACPACGGIKPFAGVEREWSSKAVGHRKACALKALTPSEKEPS